MAAGIGSSEASFIFEPGIEVILVLGGLGVSVLVHLKSTITSWPGSLAITRLTVLKTGHLSLFGSSS